MHTRVSKKRKHLSCRKTFTRISSASEDYEVSEKVFVDFENIPMYNMMDENEDDFLKINDSYSSNYCLTGGEEKFDSMDEVTCSQETIFNLIIID